MKGLRTLIRLNRWQLDEKRQKVAALGSLANRLQVQIDDLDREMVAEEKLAAESVEARYTYTAYAEAAKERRQNLADSLDAVKRQIAGAEDEVAEAFQEVKRHELVLANREKHARMAAEQRDQAVLDEVALQGHRRRSRQ